ncbi:zinc-dependent alcohol dehydrogenase [Oceanicella actignis]|uniref:zinc-dependent alcohol dehydrogenase n=1 Tax=Oceanicella actignis TaxID=1189325 RepID=UPI00125BDA65|nr:zinc-binding alcohol dehydrogenase [Oceanicella actignis]TYO91342.1 threonine dehydrogenase-like Zn-dependent dehydrogenase [Oceanicella actignis]
MEAHALVYAAPRRAEIRPVALPDAPPGPSHVLVRALASGLSRGTERLVFEGRVPASEHARMRAPMQVGDFPFPVRYGYALAAEVEQGPPELAGKRVFALHPHQTRAWLPARACHLLPPGLPPARATLAANTETALTALWDAGAGPGDRILVVGAGVVGCLIARLAARMPGCEVFVTDRVAERARIAGELAVTWRAPDDLPAGCDLAFNCTGAGAGLQAALDALGPEGRAVEVSWHGDAEATLRLGGAFHALRLTVASSQVGRVPPARAPRWDGPRRLAAALRILAEDPALDALIEHRAPFFDLPARLPALLAPGAPGGGVAIAYPPAGRDGAPAQARTAP